VVGWFDDIGTLAGPAIRADPAGRIIATATLIYDLFIGFFQGFLVAYLYLPKAFAKAQRFEGSKLNDQGIRLNLVLPLGAYLSSYLDRELPWATKHSPRAASSRVLLRDQ